MALRLEYSSKQAAEKEEMLASEAAEANPKPNPKADPTMDSNYIPVPRMMGRGIMENYIDQPPGYFQSITKQPNSSEQQPPLNQLAVAHASGEKEDDMFEEDKFPSTYMGWSICVLCCINWPFGLVALCFSYESSKAKCRNDLPMALRFSKRAKYVNIAGIAISFVTFLILILICVGSSYDETHLHYFFVNHD